MRIGTPALTTRGFKEAEFVQVADFIDRAVKIAQDCQQQTPAPGGHMDRGEQGPGATGLLR
jgi:glycine hydroxymethyltransferase